VCLCVECDSQLQVQQQGETEKERRLAGWLSAPRRCTTAGMRHSPSGVRTCATSSLTFFMGSQSIRPCGE
jgi:hypothetical protein